MGAQSFFTKSLHPLRCHLVSDKTPKSSLQALLENALGKTRQFLRVFWRKKNELASDTYRYQYRLPVEFFPKNSVPTVPSKSKFISYRPGFIREVTSRWVSDSLVGALSKQTQRKVFQGGSGPMLCFIGFALAKKSSLLTEEEELEGVSHEIREAFKNVPWRNYEKELFPVFHSDKQFTVSDLKIGNMIAKGCNAAVYSACLEDKNYDLELSDGGKETGEVVPMETSTRSEESRVPWQSKLIISHSEGDHSLMSNAFEAAAYNKDAELAEELEPYNLAVKLMFNYSAESNAYAIWRAMYKETLPVMMEFAVMNGTKQKVRKKKLKPHPNIVEMYFAFADQIPLLPGAFTNYPQALPARLLSDGCGRNMTLFLVMKRYHCSLQDYLKVHDLTTRTSLLLFTQLLEALTYLLQTEVTHRDLKTDNILLDLSYGVASPRLVVTDFGCSLESLQLPYHSYDIEKGGNMALMAPEVVNAEPFTVIDYSRSDLWTAASLAYEIFGGANPFYSSNSYLKNDSYDEDSLPSLPEKTPPVIQKLVKDMLHVNPSQRPSPNFAATVCQILLHAPSDLLNSNSRIKLGTKALEWMFLLSAKTYLEASLQNTTNASIEFELRHTFCSRIQYLDILEGLKYIQDC